MYMYSYPSPLTYLPIWCVYTVGVCLQNFICIGAGDSRLAFPRTARETSMSDPLPAVSLSSSIGDTSAIASVRTDAQLISS